MNLSPWSRLGLLAGALSTIGLVGVGMSAEALAGHRHYRDWKRHGCWHRPVVRYHCGRIYYATKPQPRQRDVVDTAVVAGSFKTLVAAVQAADLVQTLKGEGPFTVFAPTDEAFAKLPDGTLEDLLKPENKEKLQAILLYHVVPGKVMAADVVKLDRAKTAGGKDVSIRVTAGKVKVNDANVVKTDITATNGVIHVIDTVLLPPSN